MIFCLKKRKPGKYSIEVPADKSISHRSILLNIIAKKGQAKISNILISEDTLATIDFAKRIGFYVELDQPNKAVFLKKDSLKKDIGVFDCRNSGTTARHIISIMSGLNIRGTIDGDRSLRKRPMKRITGFLSQMGAKFDGNFDFLPIKIEDSKLKKIIFGTDLASAQQKSAFIIASLLAQGEKAIFEYSISSRDHTEIMLNSMGVDLVHRDENGIKKILITGERPEKMKDFKVPGDFSSAAFFIVLALLSRDMQLEIKDVNLNNSRTGLLDVLKKMGGDITVIKKNDIGELKGDIIIKNSLLSGINIEDKELIPRMIDEFPVLAIAMAMADSKSRVENVRELRVKESDRIDKIARIVRFCGAGFESGEDWYMIDPEKKTMPCDSIDTEGDHRIIMSAILASIITERELKLDDISGINVSFPDFFKLLKEIGYEYKCSD